MAASAQIVQWGSSFPMQFFRPQDYLENGSEAVPELLQGLAGNTRLMKELLAGAASGVAPCAPRASYAAVTSSGPGHDHSGATMGKPLQLTLWSALFGYNYDHKAATVTNGLCPRNRVTNTATRAGLLDTMARLVWIPTAPPGGCYWTVRFGIVTHGTTNYQINFTCANDGWEYTQNKSHTAGENAWQFGTRIRCRPGQHQSDLRIALEAQYVAATSDVSLMFAAIYQDLTVP